MWTNYREWRWKQSSGNFRPRVNFTKPICQNLYLKYKNIYGIFKFLFIKALIPKCSQHNAKNDGVFNVPFYKTNLALKMPKWANKILKLVKCCSIFAPKKWGFKCQNKFLGIFTRIKTCCMKMVQKNLGHGGVTEGWKGSKITKNCVT